jgi:hypothetical protein
MTDVYVETRTLVAHITNHIQGSAAFERNGPQSLGTKVVKDGSGLPCDTHEACVKAAKRVIGAAAAAELPCSGVFFADMDPHPATPADMATALDVALKHGRDVWLSRKGKLTVGQKVAPKKAAGKPKVPHTAAQSEALAAFLKA